MTDLITAWWAGYLMGVAGVGIIYTVAYCMVFTKEEGKDA